MYADSSRHEFREKLDLRQVPIDLIESLDLLLDELLDQALGVAVGEVNLRVKLLRVLDCASSAEGEHDRWQKIHLLHGKQRLLKVGLLFAVDTLTGASIGPLSPARLHILGDYLLDGVLLGLDSLFLEVDPLLLVWVIELLLLILTALGTGAALLRIILLLLRLILEHAALLGALLEGLVVDRLVLLLERHHLAVND